MKTNCFHTATILVSLVAAAPFAMAQKPATDIPKTGQASPYETSRGAATEEMAPDTEKTTPIPGRAASQPGRPDGRSVAVITGVIGSNPSFSTFRRAVDQAGLEGTLSDKDATFTIFAPTDSAFDKLPAGTLDKLMKPENKDKLRSLLLYHVVSGRMTAAEVKSGDVKTLNGETLKIAAGGNTVQVENTAVVASDMMAANGVIHSINTVLIPKSLEGFADLPR